LEFSDQKYKFLKHIINLTNYLFLFEIKIRAILNKKTKTDLLNVSQKHIKLEFHQTIR